MKRLLIILLMFAFGLTNAYTQKLSVIKATEQKWSGGVVGRSGVNYSISIKVEKGKVTFDSVYINSRGYALSPAGPQRGNLWLDTAKNSYTIGVTELHIARPDPVTQKTEEPYTGPTRAFNGKALVVYTYKKRKHLFLVKEISALPPKMYP